MKLSKNEIKLIAESFLNSDWQPAHQFSLSEEGRKFIMDEECGNNYSASICASGKIYPVPSIINGEKVMIDHIGIGHKIKKGDKFKTPIGETQIQNLFNQDIKDHMAWVPKIKVNITQSMFDALLSISFNVGKYGIDPIIDHINREDYYDAAMEIIGFKIGAAPSALRDRRKKEARLFSKQGVHPPLDFEDIKKAGKATFDFLTK